MNDATPETARLVTDVALFGERDGQMYVLMIRRGWDPFVGHLALPGGHVDTGEAIETAAYRELEEETGVHVRHLTYVGAYAEPGRDPRGRYVTFAYTARVGHLLKPTAGDDATAAEWVLVDEVLATGTTLAFDHKQIIHDALRVAL
jgi:8-oxo-dGTP diphosphatase